jgi:diguanylate cyclase (GGDEF)-like protein
LTPSGRQDVGSHREGHELQQVRQAPAYENNVSLRWRIVLLVLLATLLPAAVLGAYLFQNRKAQVSIAEHNLGALTGYAAQDLLDKVRGTVQLLHGLSHAPDLDSADKPACSSFLAEVLRRYPQFTGLLTIRPDGKLHCDSLETGRVLDLNDRGYFKQARASEDPAFEAAFGRLTGNAVIQVAFPARDSRGILKYVLLASLNLREFAARFNSASAYEGLQMIIWNNQGTVMVALPDNGPAKMAGTAQPDSPLYRFVSSKQGGDTAELAGADGKLWIWARSELPTAAGGGLSISLGIPRDALLSTADRELRQALIMLGSVTLLAFLTAMLLAEVSIRRQVSRITAVAARQGLGDYSARIGSPYPRGELGNLMGTLDATATAVQSQQVEIGQKSVELRRINRTLRMLSAINSTIVRLHDRTELFKETCRIAADEGQFPVCWIGLLDHDTMRVRPVAWRGVDQAYVDSLSDAAMGSESVVGQALRRREAIVVNDIADDSGPLVAKSEKAPGSRSLAVFPLLVSGEPAAVLVLHAPDAGFFDVPEMELLNELAGDVSFALEYIAKSEKLDYLAYYDPLTGLANRALFLDRLGQFLSMAGHDVRRLALIVLDVEGFRTINSSLGRASGDGLLKQIAARAVAQIGDARWMARIGADHFAWMIPDDTELDDVARRVERLNREVFAQSFVLNGTELHVSARFGIALFPENGAEADELFAHAEAALKKSKSGSERYTFYSPNMTEQVAEKLALQNRLRLALQNDEFVLHYQPKVDLASMRIVGVEALIRWQSPELGLVPPMKFIPLLEESGLILQVGA